MDGALHAFLDDLYAWGVQNDAGHTAHGERMRNITPDTGELLRMVVISGVLRRVLGLGPSNAYSTLWLADACRQIDGKVTTYEYSPSKYALAQENIRRAGLEAWVDARH